MIETIEKIDFTILDFIHSFAKIPLLDKIMTFITTLGDYGAIWIVTAVLMLCSKKYRTTGIMLVTGLAIGLIVGNSILKPLVGRPRPFLVKEGIELIINAPGGYSFPSGHTLSSVIGSTIIFLRHKKIGYAAIILAVLIAFSRLYLYVHFPSDVLGAAVLGIIVAVLINKKSEKNNDSTAEY